MRSGSDPGEDAAVGEILLYETEDGRARVECRFADETLWMSQALMAELFQTTKQNVAKHLRSIFEEGELRAEAVVNHWLTTAADGKRYRVQHYNLDAILAVGYRVRSPCGTQFRRWATERLREYLVKGFVLDDERLKHPPVAALGVPDYFDELLERIRDIRASEARMYLRVKEIFALAADYVPGRQDTGRFFATMQNNDEPLLPPRHARGGSRRCPAVLARGAGAGRRLRRPGLARPGVPRPVD